MPVPKAGPPKAPPRKPPGLLVRARRILLQPKKEWEAINGEFTNAGAIYKGYVVLLAAVGPVASMAGTLVFGVQGTLFGPVPTAPLTAVQDGITRYVLGLASVFALAFVLERLAPAFAGQANQVQALKVAAYASTPAWLFGSLALIPPLAPYHSLGVLWTLYLVRAGAPLLLKVPEDEPDKAKIFGLVAIVVTVLVALLFEGLASAFA